jgi:hypothetical protein
MYKDQYGSDEAARAAFNNAVVSGNLDRRTYSDNFDTMRLQKETMDLKKQQLAINREMLNIKKQQIEAKKRKEEEKKAKGWTYRQLLNIMTNGRQ